MKLGIPETKSLQMNGWFRWFISFWGTFGQVSGGVWQISFREFFNKLWCLSSLGLSKIGTTTWVGFSKNWGWWLLMIPQRAFKKNPPDPQGILMSFWLQAYSAMNFGRIGDRPTGDVPLQVPLMTWGSMVIGSMGCSFTYLQMGYSLGWNNPLILTSWDIQVPGNPLMTLMTRLFWMEGGKGPCFFGGEKYDRPSKNRVYSLLGGLLVCDFINVPLFPPRTQPWPLFLKVNPSNKALSKQNKVHLGSRHIVVELPGAWCLVLQVD